MNKIVTTEEKQTEDCLNIRYVFTFDVPVSKRTIYDNQETIKVSGVVSWPNETDMKRIQTDLERRHKEFQDKLNEELITKSSVDSTWDGSKWL